MLTIVWLLAVVVGFFALAYVNATGWLWTAAIAAALAVAWAAHALPLLVTLVLAIALILLALPLNLPSLRRKLISDAVFSAFRRVLPPMSQTERDAIEAGTVWWDGELFSGNPDWEKLLAMPQPKLTADEQRFLDRECDELCAMVSDWETTQVYRDLPPQVWQYVKDKGFLGMIIPKSYGGLGFSGFAHSQVITKLSTHSSTIAVTVMVPNTLGPVATILGLAFRAYDPDHLLGDKEDLGITCALIPTHHPGVNIGRRHMPLNAVFQNGPNWGKDVFIPIEWVIGGRAQVGNGWRMLMESLAAGRGISLPSSSTGMAKLAVRATGGYARVRSQFKTPIGKFEGVEEALARMGGNLYMMDATRMLTALAVDLGEKPAVPSAIAKFHLTDRARQVINDAMDVVGGKGICMGPSNFLGAAYMQMPVSITVEGANILTRSL